MKKLLDLEKIFGDLDHAFWLMTWKWDRRRHPKKYKGWVKDKYYRRIKGRDWRFLEKGNPEPLILLGPTRFIRHTKIKGQVLGAIAEYDKVMTAQKLRAARNRKSALNGKCEGRKSYHETDPALIAEIKRLRRKPKH